MSFRLSVLKNMAAPYVVSIYSVQQIQFQSLCEKERSHITQHYGEELSPNSHVCKAHHIEAKHRLSDGTSNDKPKWAKQAVSQTAEPKPIMCAYSQCLDTQKLISPSFN